MNTEFGPSIGYYLNLKDDFVALHQFINQTLTLEHTGYECLNCSRTDPIFRQGFCKNVFLKAPMQETGSCDQN